MSFLSVAATIAAARANLRDIRIPPGPVMALQDLLAWPLAERGKVAPELAAGRAVYVLRDAKAPQGWHDRVRPGHALPPGAPRALPSFALEFPKKAPMTPREFATHPLHDWWQGVRQTTSSGGDLGCYQGFSTRTRDRVWSGSAWAGCDSWLDPSAGPLEQPGLLAPGVLVTQSEDRPAREIQATTREQITSAWTAWIAVDPETGEIRLALDFETEPDGLITGSLLVSTGSPEAIRVALEEAATLSRLSNGVFFANWELYVSRTMTEAFQQAAPVGLGEHSLREPGTLSVGTPSDVFRAVGAKLGHVIKAVAAAMTAPACGLFLPDTSRGDVVLCAHAGFEEGDLLRGGAFGRGLTRVFTRYVPPRVDVSFVPIGDGAPPWNHSRALGFDTGLAIQDAYGHFGLKRPDKAPHQVEAGETSPYESDSQLSPELTRRSGSDTHDDETGQPRRGPVVVLGPYAYAFVALPETLWTLPPSTRLPSGIRKGVLMYNLEFGLAAGAVVKCLGRLQSPLDRPLLHESASPPPYSQRELRVLDRIAARLSGVLRRLFTQHIRALEDYWLGLLSRAVARGATLAEGLELLRSRLDAWAVLLVRSPGQAPAVQRPLLEAIAIVRRDEPWVEHGLDDDALLRRLSATKGFVTGVHQARGNDDTPYFGTVTLPRGSQREDRAVAAGFQSLSREAAGQPVLVIIDPSHQLGQGGPMTSSAAPLFPGLYGPILLGAGRILAGLRRPTVSTTMGRVQATLEASAKDGAVPAKDSLDMASDFRDFRDAWRALVDRIPPVGNRSPELQDNLEAIARGVAGCFVKQGALAEVLEVDYRKSADQVRAVLGSRGSWRDARRRAIDATLPTLTDVIVSLVRELPGGTAGASRASLGSARPGS